MDRIVVEDLCLKYKIHFRNENMTFRRILIDGISRIFSSQSKRTASGFFGGSDFWALQGMSFTVKEGEVVGIVGANGAGKSTLLMVLAGIFAPNKGSVKTMGRIGTLLSLGAGFNNELTGRENVRLSGICLGFSRQEIAEKEKGIIELAGLGEFIDAPLKAYSNGMRARLGFAVSVNIDPDILLIDEVLQAGDIKFRKKAGDILQKFQDQNKTIVVVTHAMELVLNSCNRAILLDKGKILEDGKPDDVINTYSELQE